jgi:hypothetical protein
MDIKHKSRYDWDSLPPRYMWAATDRNGTKTAFELEPRVCGEGWSRQVGFIKILVVGSITEDVADWESSLERRPAPCNPVPTLLDWYHNH